MRHGEVEIRETEDGPHLYGVLIQEGRAARRRREVFAPGAVEWPSDGVGILTRHHGAPEVRAVPNRQPDGRITLKAPATEAIRGAVSAGRRFMSVEFHSLRERRTESGIREILRALVPDVALVDSPEYAQTAAEVRRSRGYTMGFSSGGHFSCRCADTDTSEISFEPNAFDAMRLLQEGAIKSGTDLATHMRTVRGITDEALARIAKTDVSSYNVSAISRGAGDVVADTVTNSLRFKFERGGGMRLTIDPLDTEAGRRTRELIEAGVPVYARPMVDMKLSPHDVQGDLVRIRQALFRYVLTKPTDHTGGMKPLAPVRREGRGLSRRRRLLLGAV